MTIDPHPGPATEPRTDVPLGRRLLLGLVPLASLALVAAACTGARTETSPGPVTRAAQMVGGRLQVESYTFDTLTQPLEITSSGGVLDVTLAAVWQNLPVPDTTNASTMLLRTYKVVSINGVAYSGPDSTGYPGPTLRAYPGDSIHIVLQNQLYPPDSNSVCIDYPAVADSIDVYEDCFHGSNWTNLHYHGMHVTPDSVGDDVLLLIPPGDSHEYGFRIPGNQSPGTHWYHPHKHGSVAVQVMNGMTGALIVDGGALDSLADRHLMVEKVIAMQQIDSLLNLIDAPANPATPTTLVNGRVTPVVIMRPGEVQRWRLVDENVTKTSAFSVTFYDSVGEEPAMYDVARDGVTYADTNYAPGGVMTPDTAILVAPGNRLDVFVQAPSTGGLFQLRVTPIFHDQPGDNTRKVELRDDQDPTTARGRRVTSTAVATGATPLFYVYVDSTLAPNGSSLPTSLPALPWFLQNLSGTLDPDSILADSADLAVVVFGQLATGTGNTVTTPPRFFLGTQQNPDMQFDSDSVYVPRNAMNDSMPMVLDSVQTWKVVNTTTVNHPFHIHINPFQVIDVYYPNSGDPNAVLYAQLDSAAQERGSPIWLDVIPLPKALISGSDTTAGYVLIRQGYEPFLNADRSTCASCGPAYGEFVMHCHILGHEERGMMQVIEIIPSASSQVSSGGSGGHGSGHSHATPQPGASPGGGHRH